MRVDKVAEGVHRISLRWSNAYLLTAEDGDAALIDTGLAKDRDDLLAALERIGVAQERIRAIYLTHAHCDHGGNAAFLAQGPPVAPNCPPQRRRVYISRTEAPYLTGERPTYAHPGLLKRLMRPAMTAVMLTFEHLHPVAPCTPDELLDDGCLIDAPGGPLRVVFSPGHSPGHIAFYREQDGLLFSGDAILNISVRGKVGLCLPLGIFCEDYAEANRSARRLAELRPTALFSGHGPPLQEGAAEQVAAWAKSLKG